LHFYDLPPDFPPQSVHPRSALSNRGHTKSSGDAIRLGSVKWPSVHDARRRTESGHDPCRTTYKHAAANAQVPRESPHSHRPWSLLRNLRSWWCSSKSRTPNSPIVA